MGSFKLGGCNDLRDKNHPGLHKKSTMFLALWELVAEYFELIKEVIFRCFRATATVVSEKLQVRLREKHLCSERVKDTWLQVALSLDALDINKQV